MSCISRAKSRVVVTGMGAVTPIGIGVPSYWEHLLDGTEGTGPVTRFDTADLPVHVMAEVKGFDPDRYIPHKLQGKMPLFTQYTYAAAEEAITDAALQGDPHRLGLVMGTAMNGVADIAETQRAFEAGSSKRASPSFVPRVLGNMAACQVAIAHDLQGPSFTLNTACSSGDDAITLAAMLLQSGAADAMVVLGGESINCPLVMASLASARVLASGAGRPFDKERDGFVIGEGGGALVLETEEHAKARGARIYAELLGAANGNDAFHMTTPRPGGEGGAACVRLALEAAGVRPEEVDYVNGHGTGTQKGDALECAAFHAVFGEHASRIPMSSLKGATGHMMGAGGITESIACILAIREGILPPTLHYANPDPDCAIDCVPNVPRKAEIRIAVNNAFGFGGQNASLIFGRYD